MNSAAHMAAQATSRPSQFPIHAVVGIVAMAGWWLWDLSHQWRSQVEYKFGWMVLMLAVYLGWERWPSRPREDSPEKSWIPWAMMIAGTPMILASELYRHGVARAPWTSFSLSLGSVLFIAAFSLQSFGVRTTRHFLFPLLFMFLAVPPPRLLWDPVVKTLQGMIASLDVEALKLAGIPVERQGHLLRLPNCVVGVDEACSGIRSLQSSLMAALFIGDLVLRRASAKWLFFVAGVLLAVIGNFARSFYLAWVAHQRGPSALNEVHDAAGWFVLGITGVGVALLAMLMVRWEKKRSIAHAPSVGIPS